MKRNSPLMSVLAISMGMLIVFIIFSRQWALYCSLFIGIIGISSSFLASKIDWFWRKLAHILGLISQNILLTIVFYLILFPVSLVSKLFVKDSLHLKGNRKSYFHDVTKETDKKSFEKPW